MLTVQAGPEVVAMTGIGESWKGAFATLKQKFEGAPGAGGAQAPGPPGGGMNAPPGAAPMPGPGGPGMPGPGGPG